jgi:hypothetical protein
MKRYVRTVKGTKTEEKDLYTVSLEFSKMSKMNLKFVSHKASPDLIYLKNISVPFQINTSESKDTMMPPPLLSKNMDAKNIASLQIMAMKFLNPVLNGINTRLDKLESKMESLESRVQRLEKEKQTAS